MISCIDNKGLHVQVPNFGQLMALVGATCCTLLAFVMPAISHLVIFRWGGGYGYSSSAVEPFHFFSTYSHPGPSFIYLFVQYSQSDLPPLRPLCGEDPGRSGQIYNQNFQIDNLQITFMS